MKTAIVILLLLGLIFFSCRKDSFTTSPEARISITIDTLKFDTVFATRGSVTQSFKIFNENDRKLRLSSVKLMGANGSSFRINVDGEPGPEINDLELEANDSVYVFVQVNVDPSTGDLPFVIRDSISISFNGNDTLVQMEAWGRNAHFMRNTEIVSNETWDNDLPYVILGYLHVNQGQTLTINKGCRIYVHADAPILVDGTLKTNGLKDSIDRIQFRGDRLDLPYVNFPAGWPGIYFSNSSSENVLNYTTINNAYQAIGIEGITLNANPKLILNECVIDNAYDAGIISINSSIKAVNCLVSNCGKNLFLSGGGNYEFIHCTVASYSSNFLSRKEPVLDLSNTANNTTADLVANFTNCIFWGEGSLAEDEVRISRSGSDLFNVNFINNLWKMETVPSNITLLVQAINEPPLFDSIDVAHNYFDFRLKKNFSPALNKGVNTSITIDLDGQMRPVGSAPDLGCFEKQ
jgi:hypothetical protein